MKVLNLRCAQGHAFEGWFGSEDDYQSQRGRGLVACPVCADVAVDKLPSAPRLNLSAARAAKADRPPGPARQDPDAGPAPTRSRSARGEADGGAGVGRPEPPAQPPEPPSEALAEFQAAMQAQWQRVVKTVLENTEDVGERFTEEARRIHYGEAEQRGIRGQATPEQRAALAEEGVEVMSLPLPVGPKGPLQ